MCRQEEVSHEGTGMKEGEEEVTRSREEGRITCTFGLVRTSFVFRAADKPEEPPVPLARDSGSPKSAYRDLSRAPPPRRYIVRRRLGIYFTKSSGFERSGIADKNGLPGWSKKILLKLASKNNWGVHGAVPGKRAASFWR
jgi:hypothetical protein